MKESRQAFLSTIIHDNYGGGHDHEPNDKPIRAGSADP